MNTNVNDDTTATENPGLQDVTGHDKDGLLAARGTERRHGDDAVAIKETAALNREKLVTAREDAVHVREEDAHEVEKKQAAADDHMLMLQQVNERLIITTIEAQELAEQVYKAQVQLENAKLAAETANLAKSDFLSSMSHELRTPLNAILGFAQLLEAGSPPPTSTQADRLQQITKAGWYLLALINEILDLATIESGKVQLSMEPVLLADVLHECQTMIEPQAQQRDVHINFEPCHPTWFVNADYTRLKQVLINLFSNAIKYNREQGTVLVKCTAPTPEHIRISIIDNGAGLSPEKLAQLFQPFNRLGQEAGDEQGTGIGLVVSKQLIELMSGSIGVASTVGVGSEFWVELDSTVATQSVAVDIMPEEIVQEPPETYSLLYVEDNPANLMLVEQIIERHPHIRMLSAQDGKHGITLARAHIPDVILMDINLPGINGFEALDILRADPATAHIPVVALSANAMCHDIERGADAGFFCYLTKPINIHKLMDALNDALRFSKNGVGQCKF
ncbi:hybrid sensor histidine kinase/response regulator [Sulfuriferula thiophila]|uniref:hybrid sensor histidine kinase/response regulator n=1 Tax=Sulfuriferula thiophila TaxID=1781211 RepID=UPI000F608362|nr:ATP-binding protein [Sulfuriferula thiophila]